MKLPQHDRIRIPEVPRGIAKGFAVKNVLGKKAVGYLARNVTLAHSDFDAERFYSLATAGLEEKSLMERARHIASALHSTLPNNYRHAIDVLIGSMPPAEGDSEEFSQAALFFLPYSFFIAEYGVLPDFNDGTDPFDTSMRAQRELTMRFSAEFSIRRFLVADQERTLAVLRSWVGDPSNHIRRLCSEGIRPRLPWGIRLSSFIKDPSPILPILDSLKNDTSLYVRRSVANNLGDIAKDHPTVVFDLCEEWLNGASAELRWVVRHALRYHAKSGNKTALRLRTRAAN